MPCHLKTIFVIKWIKFTKILQHNWECLSLQSLLNCRSYAHFSGSGCLRLRAQCCAHCCSDITPATASTTSPDSAWLGGSHYYLKAESVLCITGCWELKSCRLIISGSIIITWFCSSQQTEALLEYFEQKWLRSLTPESHITVSSLVWLWSQFIEHMFTITVMGICLFRN